MPELRFPEFKGEWKEKQLDSIAKFSKGKGVSKSDVVEDGISECIRYGELYTHYNEVISDVISRTNVYERDLVLSDENDIIIPASGETQIDIATASCVTRKGIALGGDLNIIKTKENGIFLSYYFNNKLKYEIARLSQGISVVHLYSSQLKLLKLNIPTLPEQQKIAFFFTSIDKKIELLKKKHSLLEQYKKGVMQKIFSQKIRFKDHNGNNYPDWEEKKLGEVLKIPNRIKAEHVDRNKILTVKLHLKGVLKSTNTESLSIGSTNYFLRKKGQFIYGKQNFFNGAFGVIQEELDGFISSADVPALDIIESLVNPKFLCFYLGRKDYYRRLEAISSGSGSKRIHEKDLLKVKTIIPLIQEQTKIANFLSSIDKKIEKVQLQINKAEEWKKGLLGRMFC